MKKILFLGFVLFLCIQMGRQDSYSQEDIMLEEWLETLKKEDPQGYQEEVDYHKRKKKIGGIIKSFNEGNIGLSEAKHQLYPLIKEELEDFILGLDEVIDNLEKRVDFLKKAKRTPDIIIKNYINNLLGQEGESYDVHLLRILGR